MNTTRQGAAVNARGIGVEGPRGWAFRAVDITAEPGTLIAVQGPSGSGRTCLLLALTGRMRITEGEATVAGLALPKRMGSVRSRTALAHVPGVADLEPALTVGEHLKEQALLGPRIQGSPLASLPWGKRHKEATRARVDAALAAARLDPGTLPKGLRTTVRDLERIEALRLSVALGLMHGPQLLAVDDVDLKLADAERTEAWQLLRDLAREGLTVVAAGDGAPQDALIVRTARTETEAARAAGPAQAAEAAEPTPTPVQDDAHTTEEEAADAFAEAGRA
ncbi:ATP-binding cassette domain-containing protein [Streptomyces lydicamycinicus]|uniref:ATP-binding cassette domain-containing protein n=1 Tax=Streptomyces lydicamycinicus TaxID=1546107 RepID=UPI0005A6835E|nr:ATP-binding cassette domain-containing protein [Streptomyces lydicamycinicus]USA03087.1 ATP-binding cassette domain-containing protein [Streptomyces lydicamycinicus]